jgi:hypothetical protein
MSRLGTAVDPTSQQGDVLRGPRSVTGHRARPHLVEDRGLVREHVLARPEVEHLQHRGPVFISKKRANITLKADDDGFDHQ